MTNKTDFRSLRLSLELTQGQVAAAMGVSERTVQRWEAGVVAPRARDLAALKSIKRTKDKG